MRAARCPLRLLSDASHPFPRAWRFCREGVLTGLVLATAGCATTDPADALAFEAEVRATVQQGMSVADATRALAARGFACQPGTLLEPNRRDAHECVRARSSLWPPYGCAQRLQFEARGIAPGISRLVVLPPVCASL